METRSSRWGARSSVLAAIAIVGLSITGQNVLTARRLDRCGFAVFFMFASSCSQSLFARAGSMVSAGGQWSTTSLHIDARDAAYFLVISSTKPSYFAFMSYVPFFGAGAMPCGFLLARAGVERAVGLNRARMRRAVGAVLPSGRESTRTAAACAWRAREAYARRSSRHRAQDAAAQRVGARTSAQVENAGWWFPAGARARGRTPRQESNRYARPAAAP